MSPESGPSLKKLVIKGAAWSVAMRWTVRILGFVSAAVLARLLSPEDYGIVAISLALIGFTKIFFEFGVEMAVLRDAKAGREEFDTAWSLRLTKSLLVCLLVFLLAEHAARFYEDERLVNVFYISAIGLLIKGFENIGVIKFRKELQFDRDFYFNIVSKLFAVITTVALAFYFRSYYALVIGAALHNLYSVAFSYYVIDYRPRLSFAGWRKMWNFSKWILLKSVAKYISGGGHQLILAKLAPLDVMGFYRWSTEINSISMGEIATPIRRSVMPGFVKLSHKLPHLFASYLKSQNAICTIGIPVALGIGCIAEELIPLYLGGGDKWAPIIPLLQFMSFSAAMLMLISVAGNLLIVLGYVRNTAYWDIGRAALLITLIYPAYSYAGVKGVVIAGVIVSAMTTTYYLSVLHKVLGIHIRDSLGCSIRPIVAGLIMTATLYMPGLLATHSLLWTLLLKIFVGMLVYTGCLLAMWLLMGKPKGIETDVFDEISFRYTRWRANRGGA